MTRWALVLDRQDVDSLGRLRHEHGIEACALDDQIWLRGDSPDDALAPRLRQLPAIERYSVISDNALLPEGSLVPRGYLPAGHWTTLERLLTIVSPSIGHPPSPIGDLGCSSLTLVRDDAVREPNLLLTSLQVWSDYATTCAQLRLERWSFAVNERGEVAVRGTPLPPIPGKRLVEQEGIAVAAGWSWSPPVDAGVLRRKWQLEAGEVLLLVHAERTSTTKTNQETPALVYELIPANAFVKATRSAVRMTRQGMAQPGAAS